MNTIRIDELFEKNKTYVGSFNHLEENATLEIITKEQFDELLNKMDDLPVKNRTVTNFNRFIIAGMVEIKTDDKGYLDLPEHLKNAMQVPENYNKVMYEESNDTTLGMIVGNTIQVKRFIPKSVLSRFFDKVKRKFLTKN